jgi:RNA polymerase sigma-70 factor, ECF subfamily
MANPRPDSEETSRLLDRVAVGDPAAADDLLARHRPDLRNFVAGRLDPGIRTRVDPSDVVQEALAEAVRRLPD